jgi:hypothetical protein
LLVRHAAATAVLPIDKALRPRAEFVRGTLARFLRDFTAEWNNTHQGL